MAIENYHSTITGIGPMARDMMDAGMFIVFDETVPDTVAEVAFTHTVADVTRDMAVGDKLIIGKTPYTVTAVGEQANQTFADMGHCTFVFNGADTVELPGQVALSGEALPDVTEGDSIQIEYQ